MTQEEVKRIEMDIWKKMAKQDAEQRKKHLKAAMKYTGVQRVKQFINLEVGKFKVTQLASLLGVHPATVRKVIKQQKLVKLGGGWYLTPIEKE